MNCNRFYLIVKVDHTKIMIIRLKKVNKISNFLQQSTFRDGISYKYLGIDLNHIINWNFRLRKYFLHDGRHNVSWRFGDDSYPKKHGIKLNKYKKIITYNFKIKNNTPYPIFLIETIMIPIECESLE